MWCLGELSPVVAIRFFLVPANAIAFIVVVVYFRFQIEENIECLIFESSRVTINDVKTPETTL